MGDSEEKRRPNANYKLSREDVHSEDIVFHYNRENRLLRAPKAVQDLYKSEPLRQKFSILRPLISSKPMTVTFISIIVLCVFMLVISFMGLIGDSYTLDGNQINVQAVHFEDMIIVVLKKSPKKGVFPRFPQLSGSSEPYTGAVEIAVQPSVRASTAPNQPMEDVFYHKVFFTHEPTEVYRFSLPFDSDELAFVFRTEKKNLSIMVKPE
jgi:hypothetical protein